jgi:hemin uptake protein HemP
LRTRETLHITHRSASAPAPLRRWTTGALLAGAREVILEHRGEHYRLRVTSNGKLILTK